MKIKIIIAVVVLTAAVLTGVWFLSYINKDAEQSLYKGHGGTFKNPLAEIDTPDPSVVYKDGYYYMTFTHHGTDIMVMKSRTLDFHQAERKVVWYPPVGTMYSANLWAPEIQYLQGKWYIYFAADDGNNENHRMYALEANTDDPLGEYTFKGQITDETNKWAIDGLVMEHEENLYFIWSGWKEDVNIQQNSYIAPMSDPLTISGPRVLLSEPDLDWERAGGPPYINEGQAILKKDGRVFLVYSGAGSWTPFYSIGTLVLEPETDPLIASNWRKIEEPLMQMNDEAGVYGPGHNSFVSSPDGTEDWIVYHATSGISDGWNNRKARAQKVEWTEDRMPIFGEPLSLDTAIVVPSGAGIYQAEHAGNTKGMLEFDLLTSSVDTVIPIMIHYRNQSGAKQKTEVLVNGDFAGNIDLPVTVGDEVGFIYSQVPFQAGNNTVSIKTEQTNFIIEAIEITRYEAENAQAKEYGQTMENPFTSGRGMVKIMSGSGNALEFKNIYVPDKKSCQLNLGISNPTDEEVKVIVLVNNKKKEISVPPTGRNVFINMKMDAKLINGDNNITLLNASGRLDVDYLDITF
jgi:GH43 family beta-xylosidase